MAEMVRVCLAGVALDLVAPPLPHLRQDSLWRLRRHYDPFLASCSLPPQGVAVDIGAGFGAFALPFARRYPGWTLWCFEPDPGAFAALAGNIARLGLTNVRACNLAVGGLAAGGLVVGGLAVGGASPALQAALVSGSADLASLCPGQPYRRHRRLDGFCDARHEAGPEFAQVTYPTLPAGALAGLRPDLVKLIAPFAERGILEALSGAAPQVLMGESWETLPPEQMPAPTRQAWLPFARARGLGLRRQAGAPLPALDVVIEVCDPGAPLQATLAALPPTPGVALHLVLPPGMAAPTLPHGALPHRTLPHGALARDGLSVLQAARPGASAAFNLGWRHSRGSHLAFLHAGDCPAPGSLQALMQLAGLSGAEMVQGGGSEGPLWTDLPGDAGFDLGGRGGSFLPAGQLLAGFAPVRARIWRRDFLAARNLWFPEHLTDFAAHHLHFLALPLLSDVPVLPEARILSHAGGLLHEEALHLPGVFRLAIRRALIGGLRDPAPLVRGFGTCARAAALRLAAGTRAPFQQALAEVLVMAEQAFGPALNCAVDDILPDLPAVADGIAALRAAGHDLAPGYAWGWLDAPTLHPAMQAQRRLWQDRGPDPGPDRD